MGTYYPKTAAQFKARDVFMGKASVPYLSQDRYIGDLPILDEEFDEAIDFSDEHSVSLEITNQFTTHTF